MNHCTMSRIKFMNQEIFSGSDIWLSHYIVLPGHSGLCQVKCLNFGSKTRQKVIVTFDVTNKTKAT